MSKYSKEQKIAAVNRYLVGSESIKQISDQLEIDQSSLNKWVMHYKQHGLPAFEKKYTQYDADFKLSVLNYVHSKGVSHQQAAADFDIRNHGIITKWMNQYESGGLQALTPKRRGRPSMTRKKTVTKKADSDLSREELLKELEYLRAENDFLKKYDALLQAKEKAAKKKQLPSKD